MLGSQSDALLVSLKSRTVNISQCQPVHIWFFCFSFFYFHTWVWANSANNNNACAHLVFFDLRMEHHQLVCDAIPSPDF